MNKNIVFDRHIEVEEKVMTWRKPCLLKKEHEREKKY